MKNFRVRIVDWLKKDGWVIVLYLLMLIILTYPLAFRLGEIIPMQNLDTYTARWQNWYLQKALTGGYDINYTSFLFYPHGLDLTLMPKRLTSYPLWAFYNLLWGEPTAYNLTVLTQTFIKAYAMYRLILLFVPDRISAWVGGAFFAFVPRILIGALQQPNTGSVEFIPIFLICLVLSLRHINEKPTELKTPLIWMILAALTFCANVYMNIKIGIFAMMIGGIYILWVFVIQRLWRHRLFWVNIVIFGLISLILSLPILLPTLQFGQLDESIENYWEPENGLDAILYLKADKSKPFFYNQLIASLDDVTLDQTVINAFAQTGFVSLLLGVIATIYIMRHRRDQMLWVIIVLFFFWLSLGSEIRFDGHTIDWLPTLYPLLSDNPLIASLREPFRFQIIMFFGLAILIAIAIHWMLAHAVLLRFRLMIAFAVLFMFFEISSFPIPYRSADISPAFEYVSQQTKGPIITLPLGKQQTAKYAMYTQTLHELPIVEGKIGRMPDDIYSFIEEENLLLRDMSDVDNLLSITEALRNNWEAEIDELTALGFRYIVVQRFVDAGTTLLAFYDYQEEMFFMNIEPEFETENSAVYDLYNLRENPPE